MIPWDYVMCDIRQKGWNGRVKDDNYIAVRDSLSGKYLINGGFTINMFQSHILYGNVILEYSGSDTVNERLKCKKPIPKELTIEILSVGVQNYPQLSYTYWISIRKKHNKRRHERYNIHRNRIRRHRKQRSFKENKYVWKVGRWSKV